VRFAAWLLVATGCNAVFGLDGTDLVPTADAQFFDAPGPGERVCPPIGTAPQFQNLLHPIAMSCFGLTATEDGTYATLACSGPKINAGPLDGPYAVVPSLDAVAPLHLDQPRISPEGTEVFVRDWNSGTTTSKIHVYTRTADSYVSAYLLTIDATTLDSFAQFGAPSRGPTRRMFVKPVPTMPSVIEIEMAAAGAASIVRTYSPATLGLYELYSQPNLSPDGLRAVFQARVDMSTPAALYYIDRLDLAAPWNAPKKVAEQAGSSDVFMTADCGRLYFSSGGTQVFVEAM
jgi:hypothetical protein